MVTVSRRWGWGIIIVEFWLLATPRLAVGKAEGFGIEEAGDCHFDDPFDWVFDFSSVIDQGCSDSCGEFVEDGLGVGGGELFDGGGLHRVSSPLEFGRCRVARWLGGGWLLVLIVA
jgi:hypothetical protein